MNEGWTKDERRMDEGGHTKDKAIEELRIREGRKYISKQVVNSQ